MGFLLVKWVFLRLFYMNNLSFANIDFYSTYYIVKWSSIRWFFGITSLFWTMEII